MKEGGCNHYNFSKLALQAFSAELKSLQKELEGQKDKTRQEELAKEQNAHTTEEIKVLLTSAQSSTRRNVSES